MAVTLDDIPVPSPGLVGRIVDNEAVLVLPERAQVKVLNDVGSLVWTLSDGRHTIRQIIDSVLSQYQIDADTATTDVLEFVQELIELKIYQIKDNSLGLPLASDNQSNMVGEA